MIEYYVRSSVSQYGVFEKNGNKKSKPILILNYRENADIIAGVLTRDTNRIPEEKKAYGILTCIDDLKDDIQWIMAENRRLRKELRTLRGC